MKYWLSFCYSIHSFFSILKLLPEGLVLSAWSQMIYFQFSFQSSLPFLMPFFAIHLEATCLLLAIRSYPPHQIYQNLMIFSLLLVGPILGLRRFLGLNRLRFFTPLFLYLFWLLNYSEPF
jgi:hypothetical protein